MKLQVEYRGEYPGIREMRKRVAWDTAGPAHSAALRNEINQAESYGRLRELIEERGR